MVAAWFLFKGMKGGGRGFIKIKALGVFFAAVIPAVAWDWLFPAKFSVTFDDENHKVVCHFSDPALAVQFDALNYGDSLTGSVEPEEPPQISGSAAGGLSQSSYGGTEPSRSFEDTSNPYRNLEDPRFKK